MLLSLGDCDPQEFEEIAAVAEYAPERFSYDDPRIRIWDSFVEIWTEFPDNLEGD